MTYNFHTHTKRCGHATGEAENYVLRAIENNITEMGFSEHIPHRFPDGHESYFRLPLSEVKDYFDEINFLREKYKKQINIKIGFEMEYYPAYFDEMRKNAKAFGAEYLILGQHFIYSEVDDGVATVRKSESVEDLNEYVNCVVAGIKSGVFSYVAHPDIFGFVGDDKIYYEKMKQICIASKEYNVPLEINFLGIRNKRNYPYDKFWEIAGEIKCPVTFGFDAHDEDSAYDGDSLIKAKELVEKYSLNYIGKPEIVNINKEV